MMTISLREVCTYATMLMMVYLLTACQPQERGITGTSTSAGEIMKMSTFDLNKHPLNKTVCDPFENQTPATPRNGVMASLFYRGKDQPRYYSTTDYVTKAVKSKQSLFFNDLNVPTRMFSEGFKSQTSDYVKDDNGYRLIEYFALKFQTTIRLTPKMKEGNYEFAGLSDDGMVMRAKVNGVWETIIDNDGDHPTKMGCAKKYVAMKRDQALEVEITYYQGPRQHISNVLMWRHADHCSGKVGDDVQCGKLGNEYFFDPNNAGKQLQPYKDLLARHWQVVSFENYFVNATTDYNPCYSGVTPVISQFTVFPGPTEAVFRWTTNIPSSSQILISDRVNGEQTLTVSDNALRTVHEITVTGLNLDTPYRARAISVSEDLGRAISKEIDFSTLPDFL